MEWPCWQRCLVYKGRGPASIWSPGTTSGRPREALWWLPQNWETLTSIISYPNVDNIVLWVLTQLTITIIQGWHMRWNYFLFHFSILVFFFLSFGWSPFFLNCRPACHLFVYLVQSLLFMQRIRTLINMSSICLEALVVISHVFFSPLDDWSCRWFPVSPHLLKHKDSDGYSIMYILMFVQLCKYYQSSFSLFPQSTNIRHTIFSR